MESKLRAVEPQTVRRISIRLGPLTHAALKRAARREGLSLAQYVTEAAIMRLAWELGEGSGGSDPRLRAEVRGLLRQLTTVLDGR